MKPSDQTPHLVVERGPEVGRTLTIPPEGARLGRAEGNDLILKDLSVSRFQCRFYFKEGQYLAVSDLASTNETLVNDGPIQDTRLVKGDRIEVGQSVLAVVCDTLTPTAAPRGARSSAPDVDLGFHPAPFGAPVRPNSARALGRIATVVLAALLLTGLGWAVHRRMARAPTGRTALGTEAADRTLWIDYEKVEAGPDNIFRYHLRLQDHRVHVQIDHLRDERHVVREERVPQDLVNELARFIEQAGFFDLSSEYVGIVPDVWDQMDLEVGLDRRVHRVRVVNRVEPERFREVRRTIEEFARNQIGLYALALPPERLLELARESWLQGQKLFDAREVRFENLARAIQAFGEAESLLETIEPKPDFYADAVAAREECLRLLQERYETYMFRSERAIRLRDWQTADDNLRIVLDIIQDRSDERHESAYRQLLDVQRRLERQRR